MGPTGSSPAPPPPSSLFDFLCAKQCEKLGAWTQATWGGITEQGGGEGVGFVTTAQDSNPGTATSLLGGAGRTCPSLSLGAPSSGLNTRRASARPPGRGRGLSSLWSLADKWGIITVLPSRRSEDITVTAVPEAQQVSRRGCSENELGLAHHQILAGSSPSPERPSSPHPGGLCSMSSRLPGQVDLSCPVQTSSSLSGD